jgi:hypothetical protein
MVGWEIGWTLRVSEKCLLQAVELLIALSSNPHPGDHDGMRRTVEHVLVWTAA